MYRLKGFSKQASSVMYTAVQTAASLGHTYVGCEHIVLALLRDGSNAVKSTLFEFGITPECYLSRVLEVEPLGRETHLSVEDLTPRAENALDNASRLSFRFGGIVTTEQLLFGVLCDKSSAALRLLNLEPKRIGELENKIMSMLGASNQSGSNYESSYTVKNTMCVADTPMLARYGVDMTAIAKNGELEPVVGRDASVERIIHVLSRRTKNNPCLIGEPGVGKTALVECLAQKIADNDVPYTLYNKRIVALNLSAVVAGTKYRGDFEERMRALIDELERCDDVLVFIDEIHTIVGAGAAEGAVDAANMLKPQLARGKLRLIGATTLAEYRKYIEKDAALERRFQPIVIEEPSREETNVILQGLREKFEKHHGVAIEDTALKAAVTLSSRYVTQRYLPDKAIDLLDEAATAVALRVKDAPMFEKRIKLEQIRNKKNTAIKNQDFESAAKLRDEEERLVDDCECRNGAVAVVTDKDVATVLSRWIGVPMIGQSDEVRPDLLCLEDKLRARIVGQEKAIGVVSRAVRRGYAGIRDTDRPLGSFMFVGSSGVGKTALCKTLAEALFGDELALIRLDMSEYMEKQAVARLIGSPPGYIGHEDGGQLTEKVRRKPFSIILLDEIEKAHADVLDILLQILEDGQLTDAHGRKVDFRHTLIIMTSNVGGTKSMGNTVCIGFNDCDIENEEMHLKGIHDALKVRFKPELLNRIDEIVAFSKLSKQDLVRIAQNMVNDLKIRLENVGVSLCVDLSVVIELVETSSDKSVGARPIRREIQRRLEDLVTEKLLNGEIKAGNAVRAFLNNKEILLEIC